MNTGAKNVIVGMSGGVDSSVAALLLKERGFSVRGVFMKNWADPKYPCPWEEDRQDAMRVAAHLDIPFDTWDFTSEYRAAVVEYMLREYARGRTPNPDVMCNREIKFGLFLKRAANEGADFVATGHYVRRDPEVSIFNDQIPGGRSEIENYKLKIAEDLNKDQSYFLWTLKQEQLRRSLFPVGGLSKPEVRAIARRAGLPTAEKKESMGICFIGEIDVVKFLEDNIEKTPGQVKTTAGKVVGSHQGLPFYTIGQREGLGLGGGGIPYYVAAKDPATNTLVVAEGPYDSALFGNELAADEANWISGREPKFPLRALARIRHRQPLVKCTVEKIGHSGTGTGGRESENGAAASVSKSVLRVIFDEPQRAIAPGQSVVFYCREPAGGEGRAREMLGGAIIR